jgi:Histidine kinase-like ATPase domain
MTLAGQPCAGGGTALADPPGHYEQVFPGRLDQVAAARRFLARLLDGYPVADDAVLCGSELAANCVEHSASGAPGGTFTVRAHVRPGDFVWLEVAGGGGPWQAPERDGRPHGLEIVGQFAARTGVSGSARTGWVTWARIDWPRTGWPRSG